MILDLYSKSGKKLLNKYFYILLKIHKYSEEFIKNNLIIVNLILFFSNIFCLFLLLFNDMIYFTRYNKL